MTLKGVYNTFSVWFYLVFHLHFFRRFKKERGTNKIYFTKIYEVIANSVHGPMFKSRQIRSGLKNWG